MLACLPPKCDVHRRDPQCPVNVDSRRLSNVSNAQTAVIRRRGAEPGSPASNLYTNSHPLGKVGYEYARRSGDAVACQEAHSGPVGGLGAGQELRPGASRAGGEKTRRVHLSNTTSAVVPCAHP